MDKKKEPYAAPAVEIVEIEVEGFIALSSNSNVDDFEDGTITWD